jgi:phosphatidylinositol glycan class B
LVILSFIKHKEFRFLGPMLPIGLLSTGKRLASIKIGRKLWIFLVSTQLSLAFYLSLFHQRGVIDVTHFLRKEAASGRAKSVFFLMPCHSTPYFSHVHYPIVMDFLTCEPPWNSSAPSQNTETLFYQNTTSFINAKWRNLERESWPSHFVFFENILPQIKHLLFYSDSGYSMVS